MPDNPNQNNLDFSYLNEIADGSVEFVVEMIDLFLQQTPIYFEQLSSAIDKEDWKSVADIAHKIKPTLAFIGLNQSKEDIQQIERNARDLTGLDEIKLKVDDIKAACLGMLPQLELYKQKLGNKI